jgi:hypothetical protein
MPAYLSKHPHASFWPSALILNENGRTYPVEFLLRDLPLLIQKQPEQEDLNVLASINSERDCICYTADGWHIASKRYRTNDILHHNERTWDSAWDPTSYNEIKAFLNRIKTERRHL